MPAEAATNVEVFMMGGEKKKETEEGKERRERGGREKRCLFA